jgi:glycosyltransferase involved in cell wall biosynthesis
MIIYASNIHQGGGKVLLLSLLSKLSKPCTLFADARLELDRFSSKEINLILVSPNILGRLRAEFHLRRLSRAGERVLCFGNLPPLLPLSGKVALYFQNTILFARNASLPFSTRQKLKHAVERLWVRWGLRFVETVYVQSVEVRAGFLEDHPTAKVVIAPFIQKFGKQSANSEKPLFDFIYVSSGEPHKNHQRLLRAWEMLADDGVFPTLALTLPEESLHLLSLLSVLRQKGLKFFNHPTASHEQVLEMYGKSRALIFPSITESFGIPLLEANSLGLPILAGELDYVREFVTPVQTFDPHSEKSIYRAVRRFLDGDLSEAHQKVLSPEEFLQLIDS